MDDAAALAGAVVVVATGAYGLVCTPVFLAVISIHFDLIQKGEDRDILS
jgi:hypothetical protein